MRHGFHEMMLARALSLESPEQRFEVAEWITLLSVRFISYSRTKRICSKRELGYSVGILDGSLDRCGLGNRNDLGTLRKGGVTTENEFLQA